MVYYSLVLIYKFNLEYSELNQEVPVINEQFNVNTIVSKNAVNMIFFYFDKLRKKKTFS